MMKPMSLKDELRQARYDQACWWLAHGVAVVPLKPDAKQLQPGYGATKAQITDPAFAARWFLHTNANLGLVLGGSVGLAVADWDDPHAYRAWLETTDPSIETLTEQTARGYHAFFMAPGLPSAIGQGCEFKTRGVCMVSPSRHPSGVVYQIVTQAPILSLDRERRVALFPFLSENWRRCTEAKSFPMEKLFKKEALDLSLRSGVIARIKAVCSIIAEMRAINIHLQPGGPHVLVGLCPFHQDHIPSLWVNPESGLWGCNQPTCPAAGTHDVINFRALARNISNFAAIKQLADEFL
jgi:hypothetical protein